MNTHNSGVRICDTPPKKSVPLRHSLPFISTGTPEIQLLQYLFDCKRERFNLKAYSRVSNLPRSTIYRLLEKLINNKYVRKQGIGNYTITTIGEQILIEKGGVANPGRGCRKEKNLSLHYIKFSLPISDKKGFTCDMIKNMNPIRWKKVEIPNLNQYFVYFEDATMIICKDIVILNLNEVITEDIEEGRMQTLNNALNYAEKLEKAGIHTNSIKLDDTHYARVKSLLSEFLEKVDNKYYLKLDNGKKFWIDYSTGELEDETDDGQSRERLDSTLKYIMENDIHLEEIGSMKEVLTLLTKIQLFKFGSVCKQKEEYMNAGKPDYFG